MTLGENKTPEFRASAEARLHSRRHEKISQRQVFPTLQVCCAGAREGGTMSTKTADDHSRALLAGRQNARARKGDDVSWT